MITDGSKKPHRQNLLWHRYNTVHGNLQLGKPSQNPIDMLVSWHIIRVQVNRIVLFWMGRLR